MIPVALALVLLTVNPLPDAVGASPAVASEEQQTPEQVAYSRGTAALDGRRWEDAAKAFAEVSALKGERADAALYWRAYALNKGGRKEEALQVLSSLRSAYPASRWLKDASALDFEIRQAGGQVPQVPAGGDDDLKLIALNALMTTDPARALPLLTRILEGPASPKVHDRALFVLAQSGTPEARQLLDRIARNEAQPELQASAVRYLGLFGGAESRRALLDLYGTSKGVEARTAVLNALMLAGDRTHLVDIARKESTPELRDHAIAQLGVAGGKTELMQLYKERTDVDGRRAVLRALFVAGAADQLVALAKTETEPTLRQEAVQTLGLMGAGTADTLKGIYATDKSPDVRRAVLRAFFLQQNAAALIEIARQETDPGLKRDAVRNLSLMHSKEALDYMQELLK